MLEYYNTSIVFQEVPYEISLAISLHGCERYCPGCHSPECWNTSVDTKRSILTKEELLNCINKYNGMISCICFMGGDWDWNSLNELLKFIKKNKYKTALYTGVRALKNIPFKIRNKLDYCKIGNYDENLGPLNSKTTNQRFYEKKKVFLFKKWEDITSVFWNKKHEVIV